MQRAAASTMQVLKRERFYFVLNVSVYFCIIVFITRNYSHGSQGLTPSLPRGVSIVVLLLLGQELSYVWWGFYIFKLFILRENIQRRLEIVNTIHYYMDINNWNVFRNCSSINFDESLAHFACRVTVYWESRRGLLGRQPKPRDSEYIMVQIIYIF